MYSFGKIPPRALESFGVAGLLSESGKVFYSSLFTTRHVGRVSDLICARLQEAGLDELRLRALLLFGAFEVFRGQVETGEEVSKHRLIEPLVLECGFDEDKVAVGVSFTATEDRYPKLDGLAARISTGATLNAFEALLREIFLHSDRTVIRAQADIRRIELVALMGVPGKMDGESLKAKPPAEVIIIGQGKAKKTPKIGEYVEIGDLDYQQLLQEDTPGAGSAPPATGEVLVHGCEVVEDAVRVRAQQLLEKMGGRIKGEQVKINSDLIRVSGAKVADQDNSAVTVSGEQFDEDEGVRKVAGSGAGADSNSVMRVKSLGNGDSPEQDEGDSIDSGAAPIGKPSKSARKRAVQAAAPVDDGEEQDEESALSESEKSEGSSADVEGESEEEEESDGKIVQMLKKVKNIWPFNQVESDEDSGDLKVRKSGKSSKQSKGDDEDEEDEDSTVDGKSASPAVTDEDDLAADGSSQAATNEFTEELQSDFEKTLNKAQKEIIDLKKELSSPRAKRWVEGLMSELVAEKSKIHEVSKKLNASVRQKEHEFRSQETILREELRRRDEQLRSKDHALVRLKEQVSQSAMSAERMKSAKAGAADDAHYKSKYTLVQKMLNSSKEENSTLTEKIDDLKNQLMSSQLASSKRTGPSVTDFSALQSKYERAVRQSEEFKKTNLQLLEKVNEAKKERPGGPQDESKRLLNDAVKAAALNKKEAEKLTQKVDEMKAEQLRLQGELNKAANELKAARLGKVPANKAVSPAAGLSTKAAGIAAKPTVATISKPKPPKVA